MDDGEYSLLKLQERYKRVTEPYREDLFLKAVVSLHTARDIGRVGEMLDIEFVDALREWMEPGDFRRLPAHVRRVLLERTTLTRVGAQMILDVSSIEIDC